MRPCSLRLLVALALVLGVARAYDGHSTCARPFRGRAAADGDGGGGGGYGGGGGFGGGGRPPPRPPCDFRRQSWCTVPGSAYPWHAVRRFVQENHGLMRRMYGEQRHLSVLRAELLDSDNLVEGPDPLAVPDAKHAPLAAPSPAPAATTRPPNTSPPPAPALAPAQQTPPVDTEGPTVMSVTDVELMDDETTTEAFTTEEAGAATGGVTTVWADADAVTDATEAGVTESAARPPPAAAVPVPAAPAASAAPAAASAPTQLFQDTRGKDREPSTTPQLRLRGVNACPVKEEVVAPFWANNTRGEVLALLNLYPFEQYVHWEKCTYELKQMYCREGCRCEQQYRLHRLLAYDPNNECRGIFSDWFKFPSCCVCRCYDLPAELQLTSRSPRRQAAASAPAAAASAPAAAPAPPPPPPPPAPEARWYRGGFRR